MKLAFKACLAVIALTTISCFATPKNAEGGGWGWAKPLNKKPGSMLYTSNRNTNNAFGGRSRSYQPSTVRQSSYYSHTPTYSQPVYAVPVVTTPTFAAPGYKPSIQTAPPVVHSAPVVVAPQGVINNPVVSPTQTMAQPAHQATQSSSVIPVPLKSWIGQ
ncbi:hypothetical protein [Stieleria varia]|uniref:Uncharacterized protein n=1 Tax=Stieleria varia TaxID=2528005 RepID=A0A5C6ANJ9_9BACT|nr:hypothetical protein [Stieleria varia]TWU01098.1 hypothetical protein Pla52n_44700 [Stieleria varia]